jgi:signal transduction histidine kinase/HAMP domain-containing protein
VRTAAATSGLLPSIDVLKMITLKATSLRSRVARRIFGIFLLCALIPFAGLAVVSFHQVSEFFHEKTKRQLRAMTKALGADSFERLLLSKSSLAIIASKITASGSLTDAQVLRSLPDYPEERWKALAVINSQGQYHTLWGDVLEFPRLSDAENERLSAGKTVVITRSSSSAEPARIFIGVKHDFPKRNNMILFGELKESYLWHNASLRMLPGYIQACAMVSKLIIRCAYPVSNSFREFLAQNIKHNDIGDFQWQEDGNNYQVSYWTMPTELDFPSLNWVVVLRTSREGIFASIAELKNTFLLSIVACVGLAVLLAIYHIRKRLLPVETLQEGTRRVAQRDFTHRVQVSSGDEFEELAASLNDMTSKLGHQFHRIETSSEIDRAVLSLLDTSQIVHTILNRMISLLDYDLGTLSLFGPDAKESVQTFALQNCKSLPLVPLHSASVGVADSCATSISELDKNNSHPTASLDCAELQPFEKRIAQIAEVVATNDVNSYPELKNSSLVQQNGFVACLGVPLMIKGSSLGVITCYSRKTRTFGAEEIEFAAGVKDQAAIAIYNSQLYERAKHQAIELEKANNLKDEFLGIISHELRTPLNVILGYLRMIQERILGDINSDQANALATVSRHSYDLLNMIESIMDATKIEAGAIVAEHHPVNLLAFLEGVKSECPAPADKEVSVEWRCSPDLPTIITDQVKLKRILQALIGNALKFTEKGNVTIAITHESDANLVELSVSDTGVGIPEESLPLIFDLFRQHDSSKTREYGGLGLGLFIVQRFTNMLGGTVTVKSELALGSTFKIRIPVTPKEGLAIAA